MMQFRVETFRLEIPGLSKPLAATATLNDLSGGSSRFRFRSRPDLGRTIRALWHRFVFQVAQRHAVALFQEFDQR